MTDKVWDDQWAKMNEDVITFTSFDSFAKRAFPCFEQWITTDDRTILEAGSGTGRFCIALAQKYPNSNVIGMDISLNSVRLTKKGSKLRKISNIEVVQGDIFNMPFKSDYFDVVFNEGVIEHFPDFDGAVNEMIRITRHGGKIILSVPNWYCLPHTIYKKIVGKRFIYGYEKSFKPIELYNLFKSKGLNDIEMSGFNPAHSISRMSKFLIPVGLLIDRLFVIPMDKLTKKKMSKMFGVEIIIKGVKVGVNP